MTKGADFTQPPSFLTPARILRRSRGCFRLLITSKDRIGLLLPFGFLHFHFHLDEGTHTHNHQHTHEHLHIHESEKPTAINLTPWILFTVFVFGPCEPLIPLLMYPAAKHSWFGMLIVTAVFGLVTIATMMTIIFIGYLGISFIPLKKLERYTHALAGASILLCGLAIQFLGL